MKRDIREDFDTWMDQWDKAQKDGVFDDAAKPITPTPQNYADDFFGTHRPAEKTSIRDVDAEYWNQVYKMSKGEDSFDHEGMTGEPVTIQEDAPVDKKELVKTTKSDNKSVANITDDLGGLANPVHASQRGHDKYDKVTPNWAGGEDLVELHNLKVSLQELEDKVASAPMQPDKKVLAQIKSLWTKINELSDSLNPDFRDEYLS